MKTDLTAYTKGYLVALGRHLKKPSANGLLSARKLGMQASKLGLETLDLSRVHEEAMKALVWPHLAAGVREPLIQGASAFFAEALTPIEETHRGAQEAAAQLKCLVEKLTQQTVELAASNDKLRNEIIQRRAVEVSLRTSEETSSNLLLKSRQMQEELRHLSRQLLSAQEEERRRISRDLHDIVAQSLSGINVRLATLKRVSKVSTQQIQTQISDTQLLVEKSVDMVHRFARDLRPTLLDDLGLIAALRSYMKTFMRETGVRVTLKTFADIEKVSSAKRTVLYRVAQESLTNVSRHAGASQVDVSIRRVKKDICMQIRDNGKGFEVGRLPRAKDNIRLGLLGMRERVEMVGGTFCVESVPGGPTTVQVSMPFDDRRAKKAIGKSATPVNS